MIVVLVLLCFKDTSQLGCSLSGTRSKIPNIKKNTHPAPAHQKSLSLPHKTNIDNN